MGVYFKKLHWELLSRKIGFPDPEFLLIWETFGKNYSYMLFITFTMNKIFIIQRMEMAYIHNVWFFWLS